MMTDNMPNKVSVVVVTHNEERNIYACLHSISSIDYPHDCYEIIAVDSSDDDTPDIISKFCSVKLLKAATKNIYAKRNLGIRFAKYKLIAMTDGDCIVPKNWLDVLVKAIERKRVAAATGNAFPPPDISYFEKCVAALGAPAGGSLGYDAVVRVSSKNRVNRIVTCNAILRKSAFDAVGGFDESLPFGGDTEISLRFIKMGYELRYAPSSFVFHRPRKSFPKFCTWNYRRGLALRLLHKHDANVMPTVHLLFYSSILPLALLLPPVLLILQDYISALIIFITFILSAPIVMAISAPKRTRALLTRFKKTGLGPLSAIFMVPLLSYFQYFFRCLGYLHEAFFKGSRESSTLTISA